MLETEDQIALRDRVRIIRSLDLEPIKYKLVHSEDKTITREEADLLETRYKDFLVLCLKYPDTKIVPDRGVDNFWHTHILDTRKYAEDCQCAFGRFLHHFPYFGMMGDEDAANLQDAFTETRRLLAEEFGGQYLDHQQESRSSDCDAQQCDPSECHNFASARPRPTFAAA